MKKNIAVIGAGNMGGAIIKGIAAQGVIVFDAKKEKLKKIRENKRVRIAYSITDAVQKAQIVILAVKPQDMDAVLTTISDVVTKKHLIVSVAAGITTKNIERVLSRKNPVIRVMPNTPALVGQGMTVLCAGRYATAIAMRQTKEIFARMGAIMVVKNEKIMDAVTAVSGSGPAYVYAFIESLMNGASRLGFSKKQSDQLVLQTVTGAVALLEATKQTPENLRKQVTSPGGTTEAALTVLNKKGFNSLIAGALQAACRRSKELSK